MDEDETETIEIMNAHFAAPGNASAGFYVQLRGPREAVCGAEGTASAKNIAKSYGFKPNGRADYGMPVRYGLSTVTLAFWFYEPRDGRLWDWRPPVAEIWLHPAHAAARLVRRGF